MATKTTQNSTNYKIIGQRPVRHDGYDKVIGKAQYGADIDLPGLYHGKVLRSPHAHARIVSIDTSKAEAHPDVKAVVTSSDFADAPDESKVIVSGPPVNLYHMSSNILARDKVLYKGHAIAAVAAENVHAAEEALSLIDVEYEILQSVTNVDDAMEVDAPTLHERFERNVAAHNQISIGDIQKGFEKADLILEREFRTKTVHQGYIEPHTATAWWLPNNRLNVWSSSQGHFPVRDRTAAIVGIPFSKVKVTPMEIGGGFGGKTQIYLEPVAAVLSRKTGHPVKITMTRADVLEASGPAPGAHTKVKMGVTKEGKMVAAEAVLMFEAGAYPGSPVAAAAQCMFTPYDIEHVFIDTYDVVDNKPKTTAYRAPGAPLGAHAVEIVVDELSEKLEIDPLKLRILNSAKKGTRRATGVINPVIGCLETAEAAKSHEHYSTPLHGTYKGRGVASGFWINGTGPACAIANVNFDGTVNLTIGQMDVGGTRASAAQQFAEVLGIPAEDINPQVGDTESIGYTSMTGGSKSIFSTGWASFEAGQDVKRQMIERAALLWDTDVNQVELAEGVFQHKSDPELKASFKDLAAQMEESGGPVVGKANLSPGGAGSAFATHIVDVEIDPETGKLTILRYTAVQDVGKAIHPSYVEGQIQGGVVQGIGWALNEEYYMSNDGSMLNSSLLDYRMPTSLDLPLIEAVIVEVPNPSHPYGARGVGEVPIVPPLAALANAIYDAVGIRMTELPMNPSAVVKAMKEKKETN